MIWKGIDFLVGGSLWGNVVAGGIAFAIVFGAWQLDRYGQRQIGRAQGAAQAIKGVADANDKATKRGIAAASRSGKPGAAGLRGVEFGHYRD